MSRYYCRPRIPRRRHRFHWLSFIDEASLYAVFIVVAVQGVRILVRPTLIDGIVLIAGVVAVIPRLFIV